MIHLTTARLIGLLCAVPRVRGRRRRKWETSPADLKGWGPAVSPTLTLAHSFLLSPSHCSSPNRLHSFPRSPASLWPHLRAQQLLYPTLFCLSVVHLRNSQGVSHFHLLPFTKRPGRNLTKSLQVWGAMVGSSHSLTDEAVLFEESGEPLCPGHLQKPYSQGGSQIFLLRVKQSVLSLPCQPPNTSPRHRSHRCLRAAPTLAAC